MIFESAIYDEKNEELFYNKISQPNPRERSSSCMMIPYIFYNYRI